MVKPAENVHSKELGSSLKVSHTTLEKNPADKFMKSSKIGFSVEGFEVFFSICEGCCQIIVVATLTMTLNCL